MSIQDFKQVKDEIKAQLPLVSLISDYVRLKKQGAHYLGLCPFHQEKTSSFVVSQSKGFYYCFGCRKSGDVFTFLMEIEGWTFMNALEVLAQRLGIHIEKKSFQSAKVFDLNVQIAQIFANNLLKDLKASTYLTQERGLSLNIISLFGLGYAKDAWDFLLKDSGLSENRLLKAGLVKKGASGRLYDYFRNRIIFPILNESAQVVGFGGRTLGSEPEIAKYLNSSQSPYFKKKQLLYGLDKAKKNIRDCQHAVVVEGYLDVVKAHELGFQQVVGILGTGFTSEHGLILKRHTDRVILVFDADPAGQKALEQAIKVALNSDLEVSVWALESEKDPFDYLSTHGSAAFEKGLLQATAGLEYWMHSVYQQNLGQGSSNEKRRYLNKIYPFIQDLAHGTDRQWALHCCATLLDVSLKVLAKDYQKYRQLKAVPPKPKLRTSNPVSTQSSIRQKLERHIFIFVVV